MDTPKEEIYKQLIIVTRMAQDLGFAIQATKDGLEFTRMGYSGIAQVFPFLVDHKELELAYNWLRGVEFGYQVAKALGLDKLPA